MPCSSLGECFLLFPSWDTWHGAARTLSSTAKPSLMRARSKIGWNSPCTRHLEAAGIRWNPLEVWLEFYPNFKLGRGWSRRLTVRVNNVNMTYTIPTSFQHFHQSFKLHQTLWALCGAQVEVPLMDWIYRHKGLMEKSTSAIKVAQDLWPLRPGKP
jgi:hypothetical protein